MENGKCAGLETGSMRGSGAKAAKEFSRAVDAFEKALTLADQLQQQLRQQRLPGVYDDPRADGAHRSGQNDYQDRDDCNEVGQ